MADITNNRRQIAFGNPNYATELGARSCLDQFCSSTREFSRVRVQSLIVPMPHDLLVMLLIASASVNRYSKSTSDELNSSCIQDAAESKLRDIQGSTGNSIWVCKFFYADRARI